jgi:hypothetical protein
MKKFWKGLSQVIIGIVSSIVISALLNAFKESTLIPSGMVLLFTIIGFIGSLITLFSFWKTGIVFTLGWILGAWLLKDVLEPFDFVVYFVAPIAAIAIRTCVFVNKNCSN